MRILAAALLIACTEGHPVQQRAREVPLEGAALVVGGEAMNFRIALRGMAVADVQTAIGIPGVVGGRRVVIVRSRGKTDGLLQLFGDITWELTSTIDLAHGRPIEDREEAWVAIAGQTDHANDLHTWTPDERRHDIHSAVGVVRGWHSQPGDRSSFEVAVGGGHLDVAMWHAGHAFIASEPAVRYDGLVRGQYPLTAWVSDDAARVPLRVVTQSPWGEITVDLVDYQVPSDH